MHLHTMQGMIFWIRYFYSARYNIFLFAHFFVTNLWWHMSLSLSPSPLSSSTWEILMHFNIDEIDNLSSIFWVYSPGSTATWRENLYKDPSNAMALQISKIPSDVRALYTIL